MSRSCAACGKSFHHPRALQQHLNSTIHIPRHGCAACDRKFRSDQALQQHLRSPRHNSNTPLDEFFLSYPLFDYDPSLPPAEELQRLRRSYGWKAGDADNEEAWERYRKALVLEFNAWYGTDSNNLASWHSLCKAVRILPLPDSCKSCRKVCGLGALNTSTLIRLQAVRGRHVNMVDLISYRRGGLDTVEVFPDVESLRQYTIQTKRYFPKDSLEAGALLKHLLREIFVH